jgi:hypothetical protein
MGLINMPETAPKPTAFIDNIRTTYQRGVEIIEKKNADYAGAGDPFRNFRSAGVVGVPVDRAILVRILDKLARVSNLLDKPPAVADEAIEDTILDAINYLAILKAYREMK